MGKFAENVSEIHFDRICRLCLSQNKDVVSIFNDKNGDDDGSLCQRIKECVSLQVSENDGLPQNICNQCCLKLNEYHTFKSNCKQSELKLHQQIILLSSGVNSNSTNNTDKENIKSETEDNYDSAIYSVKQENDTSEGFFSESDDKPLSIMTVNRKKLRAKEDAVNGRKKSSVKDPSKPIARGRTPKAKPLCMVCNQKFSRFVELVDHQTKMHNFSMSEVDVNDVKTSEQLREKIDICASFKCHICKKEFSGREELRSHCKTVHDTKVIQPYLCSHCDRQFAVWGLLVVHERKHTGEKPYSCDICGKKNFISQTSLRRHKLMHLKVYSCKECGRDFNCDSALKSHIRCKHTNEKPYLCSICGRSFSLSATLTAHMTTHSTERKYICDICGFASKTSGNHYRHKNTHKPVGVKSFHCETCGKSFDSQLKLSSHRIIHRPVRPHVCKICSKAFLYNNKLERHILLVHARERPFSCNLCGKKLASKFGLGIHMKTHIKNIPGKVEVQSQQVQQVQQVQ